MKFTDRAIKSLKSKDKRYIVWKDNGGGLGMRISASGKKSFIFMYRFNDKSCMMTLGQYPKTGLADANLFHSQAKKKLDQNIDSGELLQSEKKQEREAGTIDWLIEKYLDNYTGLNQKSLREYKRIFYKYILGLPNPDRQYNESEVIKKVWSGRKVKDINRDDIQEIIDKIKKDAPIQANRIHTALCSLFRFGIKKYSSKIMINQTPCFEIDLAEEKTRERVLSEEEINKFWHNLHKGQVSKIVEIAIKFLLATAQRRGEVAKAEWKEIDFNNKVWTIPAEKTKNKKLYRVPLNKIALELLDEAKQLSANQSWIFLSPNSDIHVQPEALTRAVRRNKKIINIDDITPHDLRRTASSLMASIGVQRFIVKKILNHSDGTVTAIYDRYAYDKEKREALDLWNDKLEKIIK